MRDWVPGACRAGSGIHDKVRHLLSLEGISSKTMELQRTLYTYSPIGRGTSRSQPGRA